MSEPALLALVQRGLLICLVTALPPLLGAALCGGLADFVQGRLGVAEPAPPALARLVGGLGTLLLVAPWLGAELGRYSAALWTLLPTLGS